MGREVKEIVAKRGWVVELEGRLAKANRDLLEKIGEELAELHPVSSVNDDLLSTTATVMANSYLEAMDYLYEALSNTVGKLDIERAEAMTEDRQIAELEVSNAPDLVGLAEIAELAKTTRQRVFQMTANKGFPAALLELRSGRLWSRPAIESYLEGRRPVVPKAPAVIARAAPEANHARVKQGSQRRVAITKVTDVTRHI
jgi:hypothetical protein